MRPSVRLSDITGDVFWPASADRVQDAPLLGLAVRLDHLGFISAHRVLLLVKGTADTKLDPLKDVKHEGAVVSCHIGGRTIPLVCCRHLRGPARLLRSLGQGCGAGARLCLATQPRLCQACGHDRAHGQGHSRRSCAQHDDGGIAGGTRYRCDTLRKRQSHRFQCLTAPHLRCSRRDFQVYIEKAIRTKIQSRWLHVCSCPTRSRPLSAAVCFNFALLLFIVFLCLHLFPLVFVAFHDEVASKFSSLFSAFVAFRWVSLPPVVFVLSIVSRHWFKIASKPGNPMRVPKATPQPPYQPQAGLMDIVYLTFF